MDDLYSYYIHNYIYTVPSIVVSSTASTSACKIKALFKAINQFSVSQPQSCSRFSCPIQTTKIYLEGRVLNK